MSTFTGAVYSCRPLFCAVRSIWTGSQGRASVLQQKPFLAGGLSCNVWFNTPVLSKYVTWRWIYAACFISTIPSAYRIQLLCQVLLLRLFFGSVEINLCMTPANSSSDYHSAASCTYTFHGSIFRQMCLRLFATVRTIERKCCPHFFIHLSTTPLHIFLCTIARENESSFLSGERTIRPF